MNDLISRQAAIKAADSIIERDTSGNNDVVKAMTAWKEYIKGLPPAKPGCEDAVSRKAVAGIYTALWEIIGTIMDRNEWDDVCHTTANELPSVTPKQPGWIPTSERLPDNDRAVLVTLKWAEDDYEVAVGEYWHNSTASHGWGSFEGHVIAWHELPTPYREGRQE